MSKSNTHENDYLLLLFNNVAMALVGDAAGLLGSAVAGSLYVSLHTSDPGEAAAQNTSEANYTSYARVGVVRSAAGWTVASGVAVNAALIQFPTCTGGSSNCTHFGIGASSSGAGKLLYSGALASALAVSNNIRPEIGAGQVSTSED
jgi:hypothetical protein